jgi:uncharacterized membrane protein
VAEEHSFWGRVWYLLLVAVMGAAYFISAIAVGVWELIKAPFKK